ncbi:tripartite motif-containing protein 16-like [Corythoichthys intestinalis]|uniref:tripartite motif-containing protein 16-like n=1 Tax=Corythoichthys intestinalis TaxID=161448 RepID=UPI0025A54EB4|nr:tripartite motif-containing protein 16-like [Corythoichthys intestinalis]XP_061805858.1 tripartite motif-containing protein 16-like [Nerophis lumbriciformis]
MATSSNDGREEPDVPCDSCMGEPGRAVKSCLTCLVSFCEEHLRPHLENTKFKSHRLVEPLHHVDARTCDAHRLPLGRFCLTDGRCLCSDCCEGEHRGHATASLEEARARIQNELQKKQDEISRSISAADKALEKLRSNNDAMTSTVREVSAQVDRHFSKLQEAVAEARRQVGERLEAARTRALRQAEGVEAHLKQRKAELSKASVGIGKVSRADCDVAFLLEYAQWKEGVADFCTPRVSVTRLDHVNSYVQVVAVVTQELRDQILTSYQQKLSAISQSGPSQTRYVWLPEPKTLEDFLKYAKNWTFDPDSVHNFLRLTSDNTKVTNTSPWQHSYSEHPDRFEHWRQAMTSQSVYEGRHYARAELSGEGAHIGVAYKSIERKCQESAGCVTHNDFSWCVGRTGRGFSAWHAGVETPLEVTSEERDVSGVGVYMDFRTGHVSFYLASEPMRLLHKYNADFIEPLYVIAWLSKKENVVCLVNAK